MTNLDSLKTAEVTLRHYGFADLAEVVSRTRAASSASELADWQNVLREGRDKWPDLYDKVETGQVHDFLCALFPGGQQ